jgi:ankyrin repeat protein
MDMTSLSSVLKTCSNGSVEDLRKRFAEIFRSDSDGNNLVIASALNETSEVLSVLLNSELFDINARNFAGETALHLAAASGRLHNVATILSFPGVNIDQTDSRMQTPAHWAIINGHWDILKLLLDHGADELATDGGGASVFQLAIHTETEDLEGFKTFVATQTTTVQNYIQSAIECGTSVSKFDGMIESDPSFNTWKEVHLAQACTYGRLEIVQLLLARGASPDINTLEEGRSPIVQAARFGGLPVVEVLLRRGAQDLCDREGNCATIGAVLGKNMSVFKTLICSRFSVVSQTQNNCVQTATDLMFSTLFSPILSLSPVLHELRLVAHLKRSETYKPLRRAGFFHQHEDQLFDRSNVLFSLKVWARQALRRRFAETGRHFQWIVPKLPLPEILKEFVLGD